MHFEHKSKGPFISNVNIVDILNYESNVLNLKTRWLQNKRTSNDINCKPHTAVREKKAMGAQHMKSVNTKRAILRAILESLEFQAEDPLIAQYIFR